MMMKSSKGLKVLNIFFDFCGFRKVRLLSKFEYSCVKHEIADEGQTVIVGAVKIRSPFGVENCFSENQLALGKVRKLVESILAGTPV